MKPWKKFSGQNFDFSKDNPATQSPTPKSTFRALLEHAIMWRLSGGGGATGSKVASATKLGKHPCLFLVKLQFPSARRNLITAHVSCQAGSRGGRGRTGQMAHFHDVPLMCTSFLASAQLPTPSLQLLTAFSRHSRDVWGKKRKKWVQRGGE